MRPQPRIYQSKWRWPPAKARPYTIILLLLLFSFFSQGKTLIINPGVRDYKNIIFLPIRNSNFALSVCSRRYRCQNCPWACFTGTWAPPTFGRNVPKNTHPKIARCTNNLQMSIKVDRRSAKMHITWAWGTLQQCLYPGVLLLLSCWGLFCDKILAHVFLIIQRLVFIKQLETFLRSLFV